MTPPATPKKHCLLGRLMCGQIDSLGTRERLMTVARDFFFQHGFQYVSVDDICRAANVKKGSFYHFFESKEALLLAVMTAGHSAWVAKLDTVFDPALPPLARMAALARAILVDQQTFLKDYGMVIGLPYATLGSEAASLLTRVCRQSESQGGLMEGYFVRTLADAQTLGLIAPNVDLDASARHIKRFIVGALTEARLENSLSHLEEDLRDMFSLVFGGHTLPQPHDISYE